MSAIRTFLGILLGFVGVLLCAPGLAVMFIAHCIAGDYE